MSQARAIAAAQHNLLAFGHVMWPNYKVGRFHKIVARALEQVEAGTTDRLILAAPPRHGKTLLASWLFPSWYLGRHPHRDLIAATYSQNRADDSGRRVRQLMHDERFRLLFPGANVRSDSDAASRFDMEQGGAYRAVGVGGAITGRGANLLLIDDPIKDKEQADSVQHRRKIMEWYEFVAYPRLQPRAAIVLIMTRWHEDDLAGWLIKQSQDSWKVTSMPAIDHRGRALWEDAYPIDALVRIRAAVRERAWLALYQQTPTSPEGTIFHRDWWKFYESAPSRFRRIVQSWDCKLKGSDSGSFACGQVWGAGDDGRYYLLDNIRARLGFVDTVKAITETQARWPSCEAVYVEDAAMGPAAIEVLRRDLPNVIPVRAEGSKTQRAEAVAPIAEAGNVVLPRDAPWLDEFLEEVASFPRAPNNDQVDAMTQALRKLSRSESVEIALPDVSMLQPNWAR